MSVGVVLELTIGAACDIGKTRTNNQDVVLIERLNEEWSLVAVADGMGGLSCGDVASKVCVQALRDELLSMPLHRDFAAELLSSAFFAAHDAVWRASGDERMGTTLVAGLIAGTSAFLANVGDSRAYILKPGSAEQVTLDHSLAAERSVAGLMTKAEAADSSYRNILLRSIGTTEDRPEVDTFGPFDLTGLTLLLCSDGLYSLVSDAEIAQIGHSMPPQEGANALIRLANERGGRDNISVVIASLDGGY
jgi:PPM family protein phosphatase